MSFRGEISNMKQMMQENGKSIKKEIEKAKPTFAQINGYGSVESKAMSKLATCIANTQKKIENEREVPQNNVMIFKIFC